MPYDNSKAALATAPAPLAAAATEQGIALWHCLVVSADAERRDHIRQAAIDGGWLPLPFADPDAAWEESRRVVTPLAFVDLYDGQQRRIERCLRLVEQLASEPTRRVVVCGNAGGDPLEEIWVRQLGVWTFLPGVDATSDLAQVCHAARESLARVVEASPAASTPHTPNGTRRSNRRHRHG